MSGNTTDPHPYLAALGIPAEYGLDPPRPRYQEALELEDVGLNFAGRLQRLTPETARHWRRMQARAADDGFTLELVSGFRSMDYQAQLLRRKLDAGQELHAILRVNAAPGYSQHHTGCALDLTTPGIEPLTEAFEDTAAFGWLQSRAAEFGFHMPYVRDNPWGFCYEPWHWSRLPPAV